MTLAQRLDHFAEQSAELLASRYSFLIALAVVAAWAITGPYFQFSETWQLVINTGTTIITFLIGFLILNVQSRDNRALHLKLDGLIKGEDKVSNDLIGLENRTHEEIEALVTKE